MATLTEAAYYARQGLKYTFLIVIALLVLRIVASALSSVWRGVSPPVVAKPDFAFGKLPPISFSSGKEPTEQMTYTADFVGGVYPQLATLVRVYFTPKPAPNFLSLDRAKEFARSLGFDNEPASLNQTLYQWVDKEYPLRTLQKDIVNGNFNLRYDFRQDPPVLAGRDLPYGQAAVSEAKGILDGYGLGTSDLRDGIANVSFWKATSADLIPVSSVSEADIVRVDLFRASIDELPLVTPSYKEGPVYFLLSGTQDKRRILSWHYVFRPVEKGIFASYPLKTTQEAWKDLEEGRGYIANWGAVKGTHVTIRRAFLAYYDADVYESYLQPIFVFEGEEGFKAYVQAIKKDWVE